MSIIKSIGKNTLGGGKKVNVNLRNYNRSTHNLNYAWRSTMTVGTLTPFMCELALPGDTFDIKLNQKVLTHPTVGPLFGQYKLQMDVFTCPIRLYQALLHNNKLGIGLDMKSVKLPMFSFGNTGDSDVNSYQIGGEYQISPSALLAYLGIRGFEANSPSTKKLAIPAIAYYDIFKNYYANKQEEKFYVFGGFKNLTTTNKLTYTEGQNLIEGTITITTVNNANDSNIITTWGDVQYSIEELKQFGATTQGSGSSVTITFPKIEGGYYTFNKTKKFKGAYTTADTLKTYKLTDIDDVREKILALGSEQMIIGSAESTYTYLNDLIKKASDGYMNSRNDLCGLALKTHQSDIFNNWINEETIDGENGINAITAINTESGSFTIETLNLAKKVYDMLNRIAISGGSYRDWIETVYTSKALPSFETPVYEGGGSAEIIFNEVVSNSATEDEPLGTLAGRGLSSETKNGNLKISIKEPSFIIGLVSITPRVDYCQGNRFYVEYDNMDDLHKPALDQIGFEDLTANKMAWWKKKTDAIGKTVSWIDYMTNFNRTFGNFAKKDNEGFMVLNRYYTPETEKQAAAPLNYTTYINPTDYNYIFADGNINAQNFWVQIGVAMQARRVMSAKQIPNP